MAGLKSSEFPVVKAARAAVKNQMAFYYSIMDEQKEPTVFTREDRYIVIKRKDLEKFHPIAKKDLNDILAAVDYHRGLKGPLKCVVVESDWPEYESTWQAIENRMKETK